MLLYTDENNDFFPPNPDDGNTTPGYNWCSGNAGKGQAQEFNPDMLKDPTRSCWLSYLSGSVDLFRCPTDARQGLYQGTNPSLMGKTVSAARTFSMNQAVGTIDPGFDQTGPGSAGSHSGTPSLSVNGPWLNNQYTHRRNSPWFTYGKSPITARLDLPCFGSWWMKMPAASTTRLTPLRWKLPNGLTRPALTTTEAAALPLPMAIPNLTDG
ncbi:MAG: hypothetical protein WDM76_12510 [Limisphaerales bacterium]